MKRINDFITYDSVSKNMSKTSDTYLNVTFKWAEKTWIGAIPLTYRYYANNVDITSETEIEEWVKECYTYLAPDNIPEWNKEQKEFWGNKKQIKTKEVFDVLNSDPGLSIPKCRTHETGVVNDQSAARIRDLKTSGYVILTQTKMCNHCDKTTYFDLLVRLPRKPAGSVNRFSLSQKLRNRIYQVNMYRDSFFNIKRSPKELVIDHKFPSSRWITGETPNFDNMSDEEIKDKFQLLTNQSNLLKERHCQECVRTNKRGDFLGIEWYYKGDKNWRGQDKYDENGCIGCPWYDVDKWKYELQKEKLED